MTSRRQCERELWMHLGGYLNASSPDEMGFDEYDDLSPADQARVDAAIERVALLVHRHAR